MITERQAVALLRKHATSKEAYAKILAHGRAVRDFALELAGLLHVRTDRQFIATAALLHDIGRYQRPPPSKENALRHGVAGADILRKEQLPRHARACERHVGSGITQAEAQRAGLPVRSYLPITLEEKIICYADSRLKGTKKMPLSWVLARYTREVGPRLARRTQRLHDYLQRRMR